MKHLDDLNEQSKYRKLEKRFVELKHSDDLDVNEFPTPEFMAHKIRNSHLVYFALPTLCMAAAVLFAVWHEWLYSVVWVVSAVIYLPLSLSQYRNHKKICEEAMQKYEQWYQESKAIPKH